jgi:hypothetical protein
MIRRSTAMVKNGPVAQLSAALSTKFGEEDMPSPFKKLSS